MSRELDARVAEAMGWTWYETEQEWGWKLPNGNWACENEGTPAFSTNPAACEEVKKEIRKLWWRHEILWRVPISPLDKNPAHYKCFVQGESGIHQAVATTEYEAICLAFLAAVEAVEAEKGAKQ